MSQFQKRFFPEHFQTWKIHVTIPLNILASGRLGKVPNSCQIVAKRFVWAECWHFLSAPPQQKCGLSQYTDLVDGWFSPKLSDPARATHSRNQNLNIEFTAEDIHVRTIL